MFCGGSGYMGFGPFATEAMVPYLVIGFCRPLSFRTGQNEPRVRVSGLILGFTDTGTGGRGLTFTYSNVYFCARVSDGLSVDPR